MKIMFISDIHGSIKYLNMAMERFEEEKADMIVLLGDLMEGHRHIPDYFYNPKAVAELLNEYKDKIVAVCGNCDNMTDQKLLEFSIKEDYREIYFGERTIFATHGHRYNMDNMPDLDEGDIFIHGHLHVPIAEVIDGVYYLNPGSISLPRQNSKHSYGILVDGLFTIKDLDGNLVKEIEIV